MLYPRAVQAFPRFAIYYAPDPTEPLAARGAAWLGYDAATGEMLSQPRVAGFDKSRLRDVTVEPRRYGFHGTLKPPFALAANVTETMLLDDVRAFAATRPAVFVGEIKVAVLSDFIALVPRAGVEGLISLAADCVRAFDRFRAPPDEAELAQRRAAGLTVRQDQLLSRWGYPYVMEEFRFHLTLTGRLPRAEQERLLPVLHEMFSPTAIGPVAVRSLVVFRQDSAAESFRIVARARLAGQAF